VGNLITDIDEAVKEGALSVYVELLAKPGLRKARPEGLGAAEPLEGED
jgi:hypothetical protein